MNRLVLGLFLVLSVFVPPGPAFAGVAMAPQVTVDAIHLKGVPAGRAVSVFYVSGREGFVGTSGQALKIRAVKHGPVRVLGGDSGEVRIPMAQVATSGFDVVNYLVFVVHSPAQRSVYLKNWDGTLPEDPRIPGSDFSALRAEDFQYERLHFMSLLRLGRIKAAQAARGAVELNLNTDF